MGLVGPGFVGAHHIDAVRRLGFVDVVAVAGSTEESARRKADALGVPKALDLKLSSSEDARLWTLDSRLLRNASTTLVLPIPASPCTNAMQP
jgi:hypothetical protein